jgi:anti-sigma regulatory factor (Ser/Thr protein kinase)
VGNTSKERRKTLSPPKHDTISLPAQLDNLHTLKSFILDHAGQTISDEKKCHEIELAVDELLTNVILYAYPDTSGKITVRCLTNEQGDFFAQIADTGIPFDPLKKRKPEMGTSIEDSRIGGLGIYLARNMLDEMKYHRKNEMNILTICKKKG